MSDLKMDGFCRNTNNNKKQADMLPRHGTGADRSACFDNRGITVAASLIMLGIIIMIVICSIPFISNRLEMGRESEDLAHARYLYSKVMIAAVSNDDTATYEGAKIKQPDGSFKAMIEPLSQTKDGWTMRPNNMNIAGIKYDEWLGKPRGKGRCIIKYTEATGVRIIWGTEYGEFWRKYVKNIGSSPDNDINENKALYNTVIGDITGQQRRTADIDALDVFADYFVGKTRDEVKEVLGDKKFRKAKKGETIVLFKYSIEKESYAIKLSDVTKRFDYIKALGYKVEAAGKGKVSIENEKNYVPCYILTSKPVIDELGKESTIQMKLHFDDNNSRVMKAEVWVKGQKDYGLKAVIG